MEKKLLRTFFVVKLQFLLQHPGPTFYDQKFSGLTHLNKTHLGPKVLSRFPDQFHAQTAFFVSERRQSQSISIVGLLITRGT